uniref:RNA-directed DNA polymerase n=1 Tax=Strongyloides stercoralis TaxID=6248 RepID=A0A913I8D5_STRER
MRYTRSNKSLAKFTGSLHKVITDIERQAVEEAFGDINRDMSSQGGEETSRGSNGGTSQLTNLGLSDVLQLLNQLRNNERESNDSRPLPPPPPLFEGSENFEKWHFKFKAYCRRRKIEQDREKLDELVLLLDGKPLSDIMNDDNLQNDYNLAVQRLMDKYSGKHSLSAAKDELTFLTNRRASRIDQIDEIAKKISRYVEIIESGRSQDLILESKVEHLTKVLPLECQALLKHGNKARSFEEAVATAKGVWIMKLKEESNRQRGTGTAVMKSRTRCHSYGGKESIICHYCKGVGHIKSKCPKLVKQSNATTLDKDVNVNYTSEDSRVDVKTMLEHEDSMSESDDSNDSKILMERDDLIGAQLEIGNNSITGLVDTGANCLILDPVIAKELNLKASNESDIKTFQGKHQVESVEGPVCVKINGISVMADEILITKKRFNSTKFKAIIGMNILKQTNCMLDLRSGNLVNKNNYNYECNFAVVDSSSEIDTDSLILKIKSRFPNSYAKNEYDVGPGKIMTSEICTNVHEKESANEIISNWVKAGVLEKTSSTMLHPILILGKKDSDRKRFIADVRMANSITLPVHFKPPEVNQILAEIGRFSYVSKMDMKSAFYQISIPPKSRQLFAIRTDIGNYQFTRLVQGGKNSSALFQKSIEEVFNCLKPNILIYIDDILLISNGSKENHEELIMKFFELCEKFQLKISLEKSKFFSQKIMFLGYVITPEGIYPSESNVSKLLKRNIPRTKKELYSFLQAASYYRRFLPNHSRNSEILYSRCKGRNKKIELSSEELQAYNNICSGLMEAPLLRHPNINGKFILTTDASNNAIGSVLSQIQPDGYEAPIAFYSQKLRKAVRARSSTYLELHLLTGAEIEIRTDNKPITYIQDSEDRKFIELLEDINQYNCSIKYICGESNVCADYLSRLKHDGNERENGTKNLCNRIMANNINQDLEESSVKLVKRKRGRSRKFNKSETDRIVGLKKRGRTNKVSLPDIDKNSTVRRRGRPRKNKPSNDTVEDIQENQTTQDKPHKEIDPNVKMIQDAINLMKDIDLVKAQREDETIQKHLKLGYYNNYKVFADNLQIVRIQYGEEGSLLWIPESLILTILKIAHDSSGHYSYNKMKDILKRSVYFKNMSSRILNYLDSCTICKRRNVVPKIDPPPQIVTADMPMHTISADIMGPMNVSNGHRYILNISDNASRYLWSIPLKTQKAEEIISKITVQIFHKFGFPFYFKTDGGGNWKNQELEDYLESLNIKHIMTNPYHSRGNSIIERSFRTTQSCLNKLTDSKKDCWDRYLSTFNYHFNSTRIKSLDKSPFEIMFLRCPNTLLDVLVRRYSPGLADSNWLRMEMTEKAAIVRDLAQEHNCNEKENVNRSLKQKEVTFKEGEEIYVKVPKADKLGIIYDGPYICAGQKNCQVLYVKDKFKNPKIMTAHVSNVKRGVNHREVSK